MLKKNQIAEMIITDVASDGNGVGHIEGMAVFVPMTVTGDKISVRIVKVNKNYAYGIINEIVSPSEYRILPDCEVFSKCGGCAFRHMTYEAELQIKDKIVKDAFRRIGGLNPDFEPILACKERDFYRNKAQYPVAELNGQAVYGFYAKRSHRIISFTSCMLQRDIFSDIADDVLDFINKNHIPAYNEADSSGIVRHIYIRQGYYSKETMVCLVVKKDISHKLEKLGGYLTQKYDCIKSFIININPDNTNVILGKKNVKISGNPVIYDTMCGNRIQLSPHSFYQVNTYQAERLYEIAKEYAGLSGSELLLDLYCGAGTIGLSMADSVKKVIGVEIISQAIENAKCNAALNSICNAEFICGDALEISVQLANQNIKPDVIVIDPPRKGCDSITLETIVRMSPEKIVMISCNPATAARDCNILNSMGYVPVKARAVDMFAGTNHVECVVLMSKK